MENYSKNVGDEKLWEIFGENTWKLMKIWLKFMNIRGVIGGLSKSDR